MSIFRTTAFLLISLFFITISAAADNAPPAFKLAETYSDSLDISDYLVSEKFDGVRA